MQKQWNVKWLYSRKGIKIMDSSESIIISKEVLTFVDMFDSLDGHKQLELLGILLEKVENDEVVLNGKSVTPEDIGIDDAFACCATILDIISMD